MTLPRLPDAVRANRVTPPSAQDEVSAAVRPPMRNSTAFPVKLFPWGCATVRTNTPSKDGRGSGVGVLVGSGVGVDVGSGAGVLVGSGVLAGTGVLVGTGVLAGGRVGGGSVGAGVSVGTGESVGVAVSVGLGAAVVGASVAWGAVAAVGAAVGSADPWQAMRTVEIKNIRPTAHMDPPCNDLRISPVLAVSRLLPMRVPRRSRLPEIVNRGYHPNSTAAHIATAPTTYHRAFSLSTSGARTVRQDYTRWAQDSYYGCSVLP